MTDYDEGRNRYRITITVLTDVEPEALERAIKSIQKSGKVRVKSYACELRYGPGRPSTKQNEVRARLEKVKVPQSYKQLENYLHIPKITVWRVIKRLKEAGEVEEYYDEKWKIKRFWLTSRGTPRAVTRVELKALKRHPSA